MIVQGEKNNSAALSLLFATGFLQPWEDPPPTCCQLSLRFPGSWLPQAGLDHCKTYFVLSPKLNAGSKTPVTGLD